MKKRDHLDWKTHLKFQATLLLKWDFSCAFADTDWLVVFLRVWTWQAAAYLNNWASWWDCICVVIRRGETHNICIRGCLMASHSTSLQLLALQQAFMTHSQEARVRNSDYDFIQGHEVQADWWASLGLASLPVRIWASNHHLNVDLPTAFFKRCDPLCMFPFWLKSNNCFSCFTVICGVFLVNILLCSYVCKDVVVFWQAVSEKWWKPMTTVGCDVRLTSKAFHSSPWNPLWQLHLLLCGEQNYHLVLRELMIYNQHK